MVGMFVKTFNPPDVFTQHTHYILVVFVLDTGLRWSHVDFTSPNNRVSDSISMIGGSWWDDNGHGTHVSGIAAGSIHGVARNSILHAVKVRRVNQ